MPGAPASVHAPSRLCLDGFPGKWKRLLFASNGLSGTLQGWKLFPKAQLHQMAGWIFRSTEDPLDLKARRWLCGSNLEP